MYDVAGFPDLFQNRGGFQHVRKFNLTRRIHFLSKCFFGHIECPLCGEMVFII